MALEKIHGIILKSIKYSDTDRILTLYTNTYGKIQCLAKRSRQNKSPFIASIDLLTYAEIVIVKRGVKEIYPLREAIILRSFYHFHNDLPSLYAAFYMAELVRELTGYEDKRPEILYLLLQQFEMLRQGEDIDKIIYIFEIRLLTLIGYCPQLEHCLLCRTTPSSLKVGFVPTMGGIICNDCSQKKHIHFKVISQGSLNFLRQAIRLQLTKTNRLHLTPSNKSELHNLLHSFIVRYLEKDIHSYRFLAMFRKRVE